ncbi:hypothetical protein [Lentibacillus cibarius]|nr:hypothetical protein [Lentibacillus cibarius]
MVAKLITIYYNTNVRQKVMKWKVVDTPGPFAMAGGQEIFMELVYLKWT